MEGYSASYSLSEACTFTLQENMYSFTGQNALPLSQKWVGVTSLMPEKLTSLKEFVPAQDPLVRPMHHRPFQCQPPLSLQEHLHHHQIRPTLRQYS